MWKQVPIPQLLQAAAGEQKYARTWNFEFFCLTIRVTFEQNKKKIWKGHVGGICWFHMEWPSSWYWETFMQYITVKLHNFWSPKIDKKVINSSTKCLISVIIAILTPHVIPQLLVNVWLIFDLQKHACKLTLFTFLSVWKMGVYCMLKQAVWPRNFVCMYPLFPHAKADPIQVVEQEHNFSKFDQLPISLRTGPTVLHISK